MNENQIDVKFTDVPSEERILRGLITKEELRERSVRYWHTTPHNLPLQIGDEYGCPVCYSKLSEHNRLVREDGYTVCDYCVIFVEGNI